MPKRRLARADLENELNALRNRLKHIDDAIRSIEALAEMNEKERAGGGGTRYLHRADDFSPRRPAKR